MLNENEMKAALAASPAPRVTEEDVNAAIADIEYIKVKETSTLCIITMKNGFVFTGYSACVYPENYKEEIGRTIAHKEAFGKAWSHLGFLLAEKRYQEVIAQ